MPDKFVRPQLNVRLDKHPGLLDEIKAYASDRNITASEFILEAILTALGKPTTTTPTAAPSLEAIKAEIDKLVDTKLDERLGEFERRLLAQFRQDDRQPPPEEDRQVVEEIRPDAKPNYQIIRDSEALRRSRSVSQRSADRVLRSLTTGRGSFASTSPQYRAASRALDRFIAQIANEESQAQSAVE